MTNYQRKVRPIYLLAIAITVGEFLAFAFGGLQGIFANAPTPVPPAALFVGIGMAGFGFAIVAAGLLFLARKPAWWSKLILLPIGFTWIMFSVTAWLGEVPFSATWFAWTGGLAMWALALAHQILDFVLRPGKTA